MPMSEAFAGRLLPLVNDLAEAYGTPFHIYDELGIIGTHLEVARAFEGSPFQQYFAVKALPNPAILSRLVAHGSGLDCSSPAELLLAESVSASGDRVVFTSNNTSDAEYAQALALGALITFDDRRFLDRATQLPDIVAFRVAPHGDAAGSSLMGSADHSKFGVPPRQLAAAYRAAQARGVRRFGLHGMTCANELNVDRAICAATDLLDVASMIETEVGIEFEYVNFGGGLGIPYRPQDAAFDFGRYAAAIRQALTQRFPQRSVRVLLELGRIITGPHGVLVARVINRLSKERQIAGLDASMSALMRPGFYRTAYHHVSLPFAHGRPEVRIDVVGSLCENIDRFATDRLLPDPAEGDLAIIHDTGAHGHSMGFTYNGRLRPAELLLTGSEGVLEIRRPERFEDYVATVRFEPRQVAVAMEAENASLEPHS
jgi:diaminopimelate decarboxylase